MLRYAHGQLYAVEGRLSDLVPFYGSQQILLVLYTCHPRKNFMVSSR